MSGRAVSSHTAGGWAHEGPLTPTFPRPFLPLPYAQPSPLLPLGGLPSTPACLGAPISLERNLPARLPPLQAVSTQALPQPGTHGAQQGREHPLNGRVATLCLSASVYQVGQPHPAGLLQARVRKVGRTPGTGGLPRAQAPCHLSRGRLAGRGRCGGRRRRRGQGPPGQHRVSRRGSMSL